MTEANNGEWDVQTYIEVPFLRVSIEIQGEMPRIYAILQPPVMGFSLLCACAERRSFLY